MSSIRQIERMEIAGVLLKYGADRTYTPYSVTVYYRRHNHIEQETAYYAKKEDAVNAANEMGSRCGEKNEEI